MTVKKKDSWNRNASDMVAILDRQTAVDILTENSHPKRSKLIDLWVTVTRDRILAKHM